MTRQSVNPPSLPSGEIHIWTAHLADDHCATAKLLPTLDPDEHARAEQFAFEHDRLRFIQTHGIMRQILAAYYDSDPATLRFARNADGKPFLVPRAIGRDLEFSLSHSGKCCVMAVGSDRPIGLDVEMIRHLPQATKIAQRYFTAHESRILAALRPASRTDAFFSLWANKEATVKGLGTGLAANLGCIEFDLDANEGWRLVAWNADKSFAQRWSVTRLDAAPGYVAALAAAHPSRSLMLRNWNRALAM